MKFIKDVRLILPDRIAYGDILFSDQIMEIISEELTNPLENGEKSRENNPRGDKQIEVIDGEGMYLSPGFIDIHIHGSAGSDTMEGEYQALNNISMCIAETGVTSFLPTTMTMTVGEIKRALDNIRAARDKGVDGARIIGAHLEGPFINPEFKGAQDAENIIQPDSRVFAEYNDLIKVVTLAPEMEGAEGLTRALADKGITVSIGHTGATYEEVVLAEGWGASHFTHLFNAMTGLHHRRPGTAGAALTRGLSCEVIADFIHLHPTVLNLVLKSKDKGKVILVTDQMMAGSLKDGEYDLGGQKVFVKEGAARLADGQLAGSVLTLDQAVRNIKKISRLTLPQVIKMVTLNPARLLKIADHTGKIAPGYRSDLVLLDQDLQVKRVFIAGKEFLKQKKGRDRK